MNSRIKTLITQKTTFGNLLLMVFLLTLTGNAFASTTWYVNGNTGSDSNNCKSPTTACKTIGHAISLTASGDTIRVASAIYTEQLTISINLKVIGSGASTTIIDGGGVSTVVTISNATAHVTLSNVTIRNALNGGIWNTGILSITNSVVSGNRGDGIGNGGTLTIINCTVSGNRVVGYWIFGGGVHNGGTLTIINSTVNNNHADRVGGGIYNGGTLTITNSTISGNSAGTYLVRGFGGGISNAGRLTISNSTISKNSAAYCGPLGCVSGTGGGISNGGTVTLQNSIVANSFYGGNCSGTMTSKGYNMSSDSTCNFSNSGDRNNIDPKLGTLGYYGGPTQTIPLLSGSPAIDKGNPSASGCTDGSGHLLTTDQRGYPRHDAEDTGGCDMGAFERQSD